MVLVGCLSALHFPPMIPLQSAVAERRFHEVLPMCEDARGSPLGGGGRGQRGAMISSCCPRPRFA
jgi:hypothetical protein